VQGCLLGWAQGIAKWMRAKGKRKKSVGICVQEGRRAEQR